MLKEYVIDSIIDKLYDNEGRNIDMDNLVYTLFENENASGSLTCSYAGAKEWVFDCWDELDEVFEMLSDGININPFKSPESFQLAVVMYLADDMMYTVKYNLDLLHAGEMVLTDSLIEKIVENLKNLA